jgi:general nucleoside transport system permease protein
METLVEFLRAAIRLSIPLLLAALGGSFMQVAGVPNVAMEGMMLISALVGYIMSFTLGSWVWGLFFGVLAAVVLGLFYSLLVLKFKADVFAIGITLNILITGLAAYILRRYYNQQSLLMVPDTQPLPKINIPFLQSFNLLDLLFNNYTLLVPIAFILVIFIWVLFYKTPFGFGLRAAGYNPDSLLASGKSVNGVRLLAFILSSALCGLAGVHLSLGYMGMFTLSIVSGRGFIALAIVLFGSGNPFIVLFASLIFGAANAVSLRVPSDLIPPQIPLMLPYIITLIAITVMSRFAKFKRSAE